MNTSKNRLTISDVIKSFEDRIGGKFQPDRRFYEKIGTNQKRWGLIVKGKAEPFLSEAQRISDFFGVPLNQLVA